MISYIIYQLVRLYILLIFVYVILSWFPSSARLVATLRGILEPICEPYLGLFRRFIPPIGGMVDISPILAVIVLELLVRVVTTVLAGL